MVQELLEAYDVSYIYVGDQERDTYEVNDELLMSLGEVVFENERVYILKLN